MKETWLVTGSSVGLGRSIVETALAEGHNVVATARHPRTLDNLASQFPDQLLAQRLEVTDGRNARDVVEATIERFVTAITSTRDGLSDRSLRPPVSCVELR